MLVSFPLRAVGFLLLAFLLPLPAIAQDEPSVFGEVIDVRVVNLEVVVTEKGERVTGLGPDDFLLTIDGQEVPLEYFTEVLGGTAVHPTEVERGGTVPALAPGEEVGTSYLVFIDEFFAISRDRDRMLRGLIEQLPHLGLGDRMAVVAFDGKKVEMLSSWNQSVEALTRVYEQAMERPAFGLQRVAERRIFDSTSSFGTTGGRGLSTGQRQQADLVSRQTERIALAASSVLRSFANPPGRKVMMLLSGGWPLNAIQWVSSDPTVTVFESQGRTGSNRFEQLIETANLLSYTLYPVDVPGVSATGVSAADSSFETAEIRRSQEFDREDEEEATLLGLARETGGRALLDGAYRNAFERVVADTRSYYWIGFTPTWQGDDQAHKVVIKPRQKGLKIRSRKSYSDLSRQTEVSMMVESNLLFDALPSDGSLQVKVGPGERAGFRKVIVPITVQIPVDQLTFLPQGITWLADAELRLAVLDSGGYTSGIPLIPLDIRLGQKPGPGDVSDFETKLLMRKKKHDLVVSIYDKPTGRIFSTKIAVDPR